MDTPSLNAVPVYTHARRRRLIVGVLLLLTMAGMTVLVAAISRPRYRTYVVPCDPYPHLAVSVKVPLSWKPNETHQLPVKGIFYEGLEFEYNAPTGLARWWQERILRQNM